MSDQQGWIPLDECIYGYLDMSEQPVHKYFKCWQIAFDIMTELGLDFFYQVKSVKLPVEANFTVLLPPDCDKWTKVGVLNSCGEIIPLGYNEKLTTFADFSTTRIQQTQDNTLFNFYQLNTPIWYNYWNGNSFINIFGVPSGSPFIGNFKVDQNQGIIILDETFCYPYLMLEYVAKPLPEGGQYFIPIQFKPAMIAGIAWKDIMYMPSKTHVNNANVAVRRKEFYNQRRLGWARYRPLNLEEAYEWYQRSTRYAVKM